MTPFLLTLLSALSISAVSLVGVSILFLRAHILRGISFFLLAFAAGALLGTAFLHLLPEAIEEYEITANTLAIALAGFLLFFVAEKLLHLHHSHREEDEHRTRSLGILTLLGDGIHNFLDGLIIGIAFLVDVQLGVVAAAAVALHEIPQELAEFGVLLYAGFTKKRALLFNFLSASTVVFGAAIGFWLGEVLETIILPVIMLAVGTFLYVAASDFVPEIQREKGEKRSIELMLVFILGILTMWAFTFFE